MASESAAANELMKEYDLVVPWEQIASEAITELKKLQRERALPGFRPGKTPIALLLRQFGSAIQENCARDKLQTIFDERISTDGWQLAAFIDVSLSKADWQGDSLFRVKFEVQPNIEPIEFASINYLAYEHKPVELSESELDEELLKAKITNGGEPADMLSGENDYLQYGDVVYVSIYQLVSVADDEDPAEDLLDAEELQQVGELLGETALAEKMCWENVVRFEPMYFGMTNKKLEAQAPCVADLANQKIKASQHTIIKTADGTSCLKVETIFAKRYPNLDALDDAQVAEYELPGIANVEQLRAAIVRSFQAQDEITLSELKSSACATSLYFYFRDLALPQIWLYTEINNMRERDIEQIMNDQQVKRAQAEKYISNYGDYFFQARMELILRLVRARYLEHYSAQLPEIGAAEVDAYLQTHYEANMDLSFRSFFSIGNKAKELHHKKETYNEYRHDPAKSELIKRQLRERELAKLFVREAKALSREQWQEFIVQERANSEFEELGDDDAEAEGVEISELPAPADR